jgi:multiple sugar transport system ATP-binding protein
MAVVTLNRISKRYDRSGRPAVDEVSLTVADGELMVLLGPSGCGKTTTLRMIAGLEAISSGELSIDDRVVNSVPAKDRDIAMVFQSYALYPHMSVRDNLAFGLRRRGVDRTEILRRTKDVARTLGLSELLDRRPHALSGGQRQRVALGRAIVRDPKVFLFDEPLSNLDASLRASTRQELANLHQRLASTMIYVTHDQVEAMTLGSRICVMHDGKVAQIGTPLEVYRKPANVFVARFLGSPPMNVVPATITRDNKGVSAVIGKGRLALHTAFPAGREGSTLLGFRPEDVSLTSGTDAPRATVKVVELLGAETILAAALENGDEISVRAPRSLLVRPGEVIELSIAPDALRFFDPKTGTALAHKV